MAPFANRTKVPIFQTIGEIQRTVERYGASGFQYAVEENRAGVRFTFAEPPRQIKMTVELPETEQSRRQRWRALLLTVKSKLECVASGIETFDEAWMPHIMVNATGQTLGELMLPDLTRKLETGDFPKLIEAP